jgi:catechol 2,3-dioxygenase-like lactoylglutathione lyase family enzyme
MTYLDVTHIAIGVPAPLREAEAFYAELFDLEVAWREPVPDGAPFDLPWEELDAAGSRPTIVLLHRGAFRLAVTEEHGAAGPRGIGHVGLQASPEQLRAVRMRARAAGFDVVADREGELFDFVDRFGIEWELDTRSHADPRAIVEQKRRRGG